MRGTSALASEPVPEDDYGPVGRSAWLDVDWSEHQRWVFAGGRAVNVVSLGSGPPVLFVHGLIGSWQNWLENLPALARTHRVIAFDLPGFGATELPEQIISIEGYAEVVVELMDALGLPPAALVGNSMGGFIAAEVAIRHPERVSRLVLVSAAGLSVDSLRRQPLLTVARGVAVGGGWTGAHAEAVARRARLREIALRYIFRHPARIPAPLAYEQLLGADKAGFLPALAAMLGHPLRERIPQIACPTLIVWGRNDQIVPRRDGDAFERLIPGARKVVFDDTGHVPMMERPARFNALVEEFLGDG